MAEEPTTRATTRGAQTKDCKNKKTRNWVKRYIYR